MNAYFLAAALLATVVGVVHSVLGEVLIFSRLRKGGILPREPAPPLALRNIRILWATWHLASAFGFGFAGILVWLAHRDTVPDPMLLTSLQGAFASGSVLVLIATRGRHPGWIGLLAVAVLVYVGGTTIQA